MSQKFWLIVLLTLLVLSGNAIAQTSQQDVIGRPPTLPADREFVSEKVAKSASKYVVSIEGISLSTTARTGGLGGRLILEQQMLSRSVISGVIISSDGLIMTQARGVRDAKEVWVYFSKDVFNKVEDQKIQGKVVFADTHYDIAAIRVPKKGLPVPKVAELGGISQGDSAIAIGNAGPSVGLSFSVSYGIVSAIRSYKTETGQFIPNMIQTDVMINPGNEGGPIFDWQGNLMGVHQIFPTSRGGLMQGVTFFMPAAQAIRICKEIDITRKKAFRPFMGIFFANKYISTSGGMYFSGGRVGGFGTGYDDEFKMYIDMPDQYWDVGCLVEQLFLGTTAFESGLRRQDVIVQMKLPWEKDFRYVRSAIEVELGINQCKAKDVISFGIIRDRKYKIIQVEVGDHPKEYLPNFM
jgi:S1-C subfamily serine protease